MLIAVFGLCILLVITSASMSLLFKSQIKFEHGSKPPILQSNDFQKQLNRTLFKSVSLYKEHTIVYNAWNIVQERLKCCGSTSYTDWGSVLPKSCCHNNCESNQIHQHGCLNKIAYDLMWGTSLTLGLSLIMLLVHIFGLCITSWMYLSNRNWDNYDN